MSAAFDESPSGDGAVTEPTIQQQQQQPIPTPKPKPPTHLEAVLAEQANDAITQGADPKAVTDRLGTLVLHLRTHSDLRQQADNAIAQGADPHKVAERFAGLVNDQPKPPFAESHGSSGTWSLPDEADRSAFGNVSRSALQGLTFGAGDKLLAATNAGIDKLHGQPFGASYTQRLADERAASHDFANEHPVESGLSEVTGGVAGTLLGGGLVNAAGRGIARLAPSVAEAVAPVTQAAGGLLSRSRTARYLGTVAGGAALGGAEGAIENDGGLMDRLGAAKSGAERGALTTGVAAPVMGGIGLLASKAGLPQLASKGAQSLADQLPEGKAQGLFQRFAEAVGPRGKAASEIADRGAMDAAAGFSPTPLPSSVPSLALDQAGPNLVGLAKNIVRRPGEGQAVIRNALASRQAQMRPAVTKALDDLSGTTSKDGEKVLSDLASEHAAVDASTGAAKAASGPSAALKTWRDELGGSLSDGIGALRDFVSERSKEAKRLYGAARDSSKGVPVESETLDQIRQTPAGQQAYAWALAQKGNRMSPLATVSSGVEASPEYQQLLTLGVPKEKAAAAVADKLETKTAPDPETLHYMKQALGKMARLGMHDGAGGTIATQAHGALGLWDNIRSELPEAWQQADQAFAQKSKVIDALNTGRSLMSAPVNPAGMKALHTSLDAIDQRLKDASPEEQAAFRVGAQSSVTDWLRNGGSAKRLAAQLQEPSSVMSRRIVLATGDETAPARLAASLQPAASGLSGQAQAAARGLDVLRTPTTPTSNAPEKSLSLLDQVKSAMAPDERQSFQKAAAQAVRGEWEGAGNTIAAPGRVFASSPERTRQVAHAFPTPDAASRFQDTVKGWDATQSLMQRLTGGSDTAGNLAEEASRDRSAGSALGQVLHGNVGSAIGTLIGATAKEATSRARRLTDKTIADILASPDASALDKATQIALRREQIRRTTGRLVAGASVGASDPER